MRRIATVVLLLAVGLVTAGTAAQAIPLPIPNVVPSGH
jgi:hypothetical protein